MKIAAPSESLEQEAIVEWLNYHIVLKDYFFKTNNEGKRSEVQGNRLKRQGLRPGVSDIFIYYPCSGYHGLFLEVKRNKKYSLSEQSTSTWIAQEKFLNIVKSIGYSGERCYGFDDCKRIIEAYLRR